MQIKFLLLLPLITALQTVYAQEGAIPAPEFNRNIMYLKKDNTIAELDKTDLRRVQKDKLMPSTIKMFSGYKFYIKAEGCCASMSRSGKPTERFIVKVEPGIDPSDIIQLFRFQVKNDSRLLMTNKVNIATALNDNSGQLKTIKLHFKKAGEGLYLITHDEQLDEGEYVFICGSAAYGTGLTTAAMANGQYEKGYCFSVQNKE